MKLRTRHSLACLSLLGACAGVDPAAVSGDAIGSGAGLAAAPELHLAYTEYLGQLTGRPPNAFSDALGMTGTDLGISFQRDDKLYFLFGDTWTKSSSEADYNLDSIATTSTAFNPGEIPRLSWFTRPGGRWLPFKVGNENMKAFNLPVEGLALGERNYIFFHAGYSRTLGRATKSILAHAEGDAFDRLVVDHTSTTSTKFLSVSAFEEDGQIWIFGAGKYRSSPVHLARVDAGALTDRARWSYYRGPGVDFGPGEDSAVPVVNADCVGELSVRKHVGLNAYLMAYNCKTNPDGIVLRVASSPAGPWSEPLIIVASHLGDGQFFHATGDVDDGLSERGRESVPGDEYGPYLVPAWFDEPGPGLYGIVYTLSSWNPYQVHLMRSVLAEPGYSAEPPIRGSAPPRELQNPGFASGSLSGWNAAGDTFKTFQDGSNGGKWTVTTHTDRGTAARGSLSQEFSIAPGASTLSFSVHGGRDATVTLYEGDAVLRRSTGRNSNSGRLRVSWKLETLRGKRVRLAIEDNATATWGFIGVSGFELR